MHGYAQHALRSSKTQTGLTLTELMITLAVLSILAAAALPYAEVTIKRSKELELRRSLREVRTAIDRFNEDWRNGLILKSADGVSINGFPKNLEILVEGIETGKPEIPVRRYLRRIPRDPFGNPDYQSIDHWRIRGYQDEPDGIIWGGEDVYDIHSLSENEALDGTYYKEW